MTANKEQDLPLLGREAARETLDELVAGVRQSHGGGLVIRGEPGTGKTALLGHAARRADGLRVIRTAGTASEAGLGYAALHQVCGPLTGLLGRLAAPQRAALENAFGVEAGPPAGRYLVGLGVLGLLTAAAAEQPLICLVDDAQWLDEASRQALSFAARRLAGQAAVIAFAVREPASGLDGLLETVLGGLRDSDARALLATAVRGQLDERVLDQIVAEAGGNPRVLLTLRDQSPGELAGGFRLPPPLPEALPGSTGADLSWQVAALPRPARLLLLTAAADPTGDLALLWRAAGHLGITSEAALPAAEAGLIAFSSRVTFPGPAVRAAVYHHAPLRDRRAAHQALAWATDPAADPDRRAWHRSQGPGDPDEDLAAELERAAPRARARGGVGAEAAFLERAAMLTPDAGRRADRSLAAAAALLQAGESDAVTRLLAGAELGSGLDSGSADGDRHARAQILRARLAVAQRRGGDTPRLLLDAARRLDRADPAPVRAAHLDAIRAAMLAGGMAASGATLTEIARAAGEAPAAWAPGAADLLLDGLASYLGGRAGSGGPAVRQAVDWFGREAGLDDLRWLPLAATAALTQWDEVAWHGVSARFLGLARETGALGDLTLALNTAACGCLLGGDLDTAGSLTGEAATAGVRVAPSGALGLAALRGHQEPARTLIAAAGQESVARGEGLGAAAAQWAAAVLHNGLGQYGTALTAAEDAVRYAGHCLLSGWSAAELTEAAARSGQPGRAADAVHCLTRVAEAAGGDWARGIQARSLALVTSGAAAEGRYQAAIAHLGRTRARVDLARAHLLYGEWLRRENRRVDAREQLHQAHRLLSAMGAEAFAERARRELLATGETVRRRTVETDRDLTAQERQIALRAREGQTNTEIGTELFLSPRTVEWHLRKVFAKLGITSRRQLQRALGDSAVPCG